MNDKKQNLKKENLQETVNRQTEEKIIKDIEEDQGVIHNEILKIAAEDVKVSPRESSLLAAEKERKQESFYSDLIFTLSHIRMSEAEAHATWSEIIIHKAEMKKALGRNVGIRVAALDYFQNVAQKIDDVRIIDNNSFIETQRLVVTDGLTGLMNHRYFYERLSLLFRQMKEKRISNIGLLVIDLDYFKQYNDSNGHLAGDIVLIEVARIFSEIVEEKDRVFRYGGEEFAILVPDTNIVEITDLAERLRIEVEITDFVNEEVLPNKQVTVSVGISIYPDICREPLHFFQNADEALYLAKKYGRNRVQIAE